MIIARYAENIYLLQPIVQVNRIEQQRSIRRDAQQKNPNNPFANVFNQAMKKHEQAMKQCNPNGFDKVC